MWRGGEIGISIKRDAIHYLILFTSFPALLCACSVSCFIIHRYRDGGRGAAGGPK